MLDVEEAERICGNEAFVQAGIAAQRRSLVLLKNDTGAGALVLPASTEALLYIEGIEEETAAGYGAVVSTPAEADHRAIKKPIVNFPPELDLVISLIVV